MQEIGLHRDAVAWAEHGPLELDDRLLTRINAQPPVRDT